MITHHSEMARRLGEDLGLAPTPSRPSTRRTSSGTARAGRGSCSGEDVPIAARLAIIGEYVEVAHRVGGVAAARGLVRARRGKEFDPRPRRRVRGRGRRLLLAGLDTLDAWDAVIGSEPALAVLLTEDRFDEALLAIADFVDLKSPYSLGHARAVADLVAEAAARLGLPEDEVRTLRRAGLVHCFGKLGVSNAILDKRAR